MLERGAQNIIGVDLERVRPIEKAEGKVKIIQADFMTLMDVQSDNKLEFDLILCDMAPNATGRKERDHLVSIVCHFAIPINKYTDTKVGNVHASSYVWARYTTERREPPHQGIPRC